MIKEIKEIKTTAGKQVLDLTDILENFLAENYCTDGLISISVLHTTAALTMADLDPGTDQDMLEAFYTMIPQLDFRHLHDPAHTPDHILAALIGPDLWGPVRRGRLLTGSWQRPVLFEFNGPRIRRLALSYLS